MRVFSFKNAIIATFLFISCAHSSLAQHQNVPDPFEDFNRGVFWFNDQVDIFFLEPVARGYDYVMPEFAQTGVGNFFENLGYPKYLVSDLVQLKFDQAAEHTGRFIINTTLGFFGLFDVASGMGLEREKEDFGIALAYHDVPSGPYLVLPILGPSNVRDGFGQIVDFFLDPMTIYSYTSNASSSTKFAVTTGARALDLVDTRAGLLDAVNSAKESSVDHYLFMQGAYYQYRRGILFDGDPPEEEDFEAPAVFEPVE